MQTFYTVTVIQLMMCALWFAVPAIASVPWWVIFAPALVYAAWELFWIVIMGIALMIVFVLSR